MAINVEVGGRIAATEAPAGTTRYRPEFRANGGEYFRIWIVNLALTIVTLGIYSAWAKVRKLRYFYGNTLLAGSAFGYHAEPIAILKGRLIAAALGAIYFAATQFSLIATLSVIVALGIAMPWLIVRSRMFSMRMTSWRGMRFTFRPDYAGAYRVLLGWGIAGVFSLGLLMPYFLRERYRYIVTRTGFGDRTFDCEPNVGRFYKTALVAAGLMMVIVFGLSALGGVIAAFLAGGSEAGSEPSQAAALMTAGAVMIIYLIAFAVIGGYTQARNVRDVLNTTALAGHGLRSDLAAAPLIGIYLTNVLGILLTLGLYTPWAQVRLARYRLETTELEVQGSLDAFVASVGSTTPAAAGEEIAELFDLDFGF
jgi:uncharacterized membrane protein YjgN (DUF898 family)